MKTTLYNQLHVCAANEIRVGGRPFSTLGGSGANGLAFDSWEAHGEAHFRIVAEPEQEASARQVLRDAGFAAETLTAIAVEAKNQPGAPAALLRTLSEANIDAINSSATTTAAGDAPAVLETSDNDLARQIISSMPGRA